MSTPDPRFATYPKEAGVSQLRWYIDNVASGALTIAELVGAFRAIHESLESAGRSKYNSKEEARLIWDLLWALEFYSPDPAKEQYPEEWNDAASILVEVKRVAQHLKEL